MQPRFIPSAGLPPAPGAPPARPMFPPPPQFMPPGALPPPHGMMPGLPMGMHPGMGMVMPGHGMPMHPGPPLMPPQYPYQPQPIPQGYPPRPAAPSVIVGASTARAPVPPAPVPQTPAPTVVISATSAIHDFNFSNPSAVFMNATSNLLNKVIFNNSAAALPATVYVGQVPLDMTDQTLTRILEACGKIFKFTRPVDPSTSLPAAFALVTYSQAICAVRALNTLHNYVLDAVECSALVVKAGTKETIQLESIIKTEQEAAAQLPEGHSLEAGIYGPIKSAIESILAAANNTSAAAIGSGVVGGSGVDPSTATAATTYVAATGESAEAGELTEETLATANPAITNNTTTTTDITNYNSLDTIDNYVNSNTTALYPNPYTTTVLDEEQAIDAAEEKQLMSTIEQFRLRQLQRDKDVEAQRKIKIQQKMQELKLMQQQKAERDARALAEGPPAPITTTTNTTTNNNTSASNGTAATENTASNKRTVVELSAEEIEAKRLRKLEVLQMLSGGTVAEPTEDNTANPLATSTSATELTSLPTNTTTTTTNLKLSIKKQPTATTSKTTFVAQDEDERAPVREIVKLEYTAEELQAMNSDPSAHYTQYTHEDYQGDVDFGGVKKSAIAGVGGLSGFGGVSGVLGMPGLAPAAPVDMNMLQAIALAKAQALSLALKSGTSGQSASVSAPASSSAESKTEQEKLKSLVDKIPTERNELFAYPLQWSVLTEKNVINEVMANWVSKKIVEFLGEEEPSLVEFIIGKLHARCTAEDLLEELSMVLDEAAEPFVLKLWRMLVYYSVKN